MKIWIYGSGAVGSYYGAKLAQAGHQVLFVARGEQLKALKEKGLRIKSYKGDFEIASLNACSEDELEKQFEPDFVIVSVKAYSSREVIKKLKEILKPNSLIFIFQNGINSEKIFQEILPEQQVIRCVVYIAASLSSPGKVFHPSGEVITVQAHQMAPKLIEAFAGTKVPLKISENIQYDIWSKSVWNAAFNSVTALTRLTTKPILDDEDGLNLIKEIGNEVYCLAKANDINLPENIVEQRIKATTEALGNITTSTLEDAKKGKSLEYEALIGDLLDEAKRLNFQVPRLQAMYTLMKLASKT